MHQPDEMNRPAPQRGKGRAAKKPYRPPAVRYERVFETSAITCGKVQVNEGPCHQNRKLS
ncbi:MAG: hypothetical protein ABSH32_05240 [Bryobacteraceae bacterium]|jgi:hypothetical protein